MSQTSLEVCLAAPDAVCAEIITDELRVIEGAISDPRQRAWAQLQLAGALAEGGLFDAAEEVLNRLQDPPTQPGIRDAAILDVMTVLGAESLNRGLHLVDMIADDETYDRAFAHHIANLVDHDAVDRALSDLATGIRTGAPLAFVGLDKLALALMDRGQIDEALQLVADNIPDDASRRGSLLHRMASDRIEMGQIDVARTLLGQIENPTWRVMTGARMGEALARIGDTEAAEQAFAAARGDLASLPDPDQRYYAFGFLAEDALKASRDDLAIAAIADVSTYRFDQVDAYVTLAQIALSLQIDFDFRALLQEAMTTLEAGPSEGEEIAERFDNSLARLAQAMAMSGNDGWAVETLGRVRDADRREEDISNIAHSLINTRQYDEAIAIMAAHEDADEQAQGLIRLARAVDGTQYEAFGEIATAQVLALAEGPEWVPLNAYTISRLAELDSSQGRYAIAETRLRFLDDPNLQVHGRIVNLGYAAQSGTEDEYATYLKIATDSVTQIEDPVSLSQITRHLMMQLVYAKRFDDTLRIARDVVDPQMRDALLETLVTALSGFAGPAVAMEAGNAITDPVARQTQKRMIMLSALRQSLDI